MERDLGVTRPVQEIPELAPLLGRFATSAPRGPAGFPLDDLRFQLLDLLYQRFGDARKELAGGNPSRATSLIGRDSWLEAWRDVVGRTGDRLLAEIDRRFEAARAESRMPAEMLATRAPTESDRRTIRSRLEAAGIPLERMESPDQAPDLTNGLLHSAMALDSSWERLATAVASELAQWQQDVAGVRAWRRSLVPLWIITVAAILLTVALGLSLGGYLPAPGPLGVLQRWFWSLPWR